MKYLIFAIVAPLLLVVACEKAEQLNPVPVERNSTSKTAMSRLPENTLILKDLGNNWLIVRIEGEQFLFHCHDSLNGNTETLTPW